MDQQVASTEELWQRLVSVPAGEEDVAGAGAVDRVVRVLSLPLAGMAADQDQRRRAAAKASISNADCQ